MPLAAVVDRFALPARVAAVAASAKLPTVRTAAGLSTRKSAGTEVSVDVVAGIPMTSNVWLRGTLVESGRAARTAYIPSRASTHTETERIVGRMVMTFWLRRGGKSCADCATSRMGRSTTFVAGRDASELTC